MTLNENNAVLVRAYNNYIPYNKKLVPSCDDTYLQLDLTSDYHYLIKNLYIKSCEDSTGRNIDMENEETKNRINEEIKAFLPFTSNYVSTLSFSINGLVSDDINNHFSNYNVCVIDPLKNHKNDDFIIFNVNDTTIKGSINLSDDAILVIKDETYNLLSDNQKNILNSKYHLEVFNKSLKKGVEDALKKYNYPALDIIPSVQNNYIADFPEKEQAVNFINEYADKNNLSKLRLYDIYTNFDFYEEADKNAKAKISDEIDKTADIMFYYRNRFYEYLKTIAIENGYEISEIDDFYLTSDFSNSIDVLEDIVKYIINKNGFNYYANIVKSYNEDLIKNYKSNTEILEELQNEKTI